MISLPVLVVIECALCCSYVCPWCRENLTSAWLTSSALPISLRSKLLEETHRVQLELMTLIDRLRVNQVARIAAGVEETYRSAYQDRSRSLYEMEVKADLGDAQAQVAEALWKSAKVEFENAILWSKLDALLGRPMLLSAKGGTG
jgi:hypothetical protein